MSCVSIFVYLLQFIIVYIVEYNQWENWKVIIIIISERNKYYLNGKIRKYV